MLSKFNLSEETQQQNPTKRVAGNIQLSGDQGNGTIENANETNVETGYDQPLMSTANSFYLNTFHETTYGLIERNSNNRSKIYEILNKTRDLCPYSSFCGSEPLLEISIPGSVSCCGQCSCDIECGLHGDCCHRDLDLYNVKDKYEMTCVTIKSKYSRHTMSKSYYMIDKCLTSNSSCFGSNSIPMGLYPVYSLSVKLIFYNKECALCNGVQDIVNWSSFVSCSGRSATSLTPESLMKGFQTGKCQLDFVPPSAMSQKHLECFDTFIDRCEAADNNRHYNDFTSFACHTLYSPIRRGEQMFANIHCLKCNNTAYHPGMCVPDQDRSFVPSMSVLLDFKFLDSILNINKAKEFRAKTNAILCSENFVKHPYRNECREVLCPFGQYRLGKDCHKFSETWYVWGAVVLHLLVTPEKSIPEEDLSSRKGEEIEIFLQRNKLYWNYFEILFSKDEANNFTTVNSILILLAKETTTTKIDVAVLIERIKTVLNADLSISIGNTTYKVNVNIDKGFIHRRKLESHIVIERAEKGISGLFTEAFYPLSGHPWKLSLRFSLHFFEITKLYFCPIVKLHKSEYKVFNGKYSIFPNDTTRFVFPVEMKVMEDGEAYICVTEFEHQRSADDSGKTQNAANGFPNSITIALLVGSIFQSHSF